MQALATIFEFNYGYYPYIFYKKNINFYSNAKSINELLKKPQELMTIYIKKTPTILKNFRNELIT